MSLAPLNVCVFCASSPKVDDHYKALAYDMGAMIGAQGWRLIYGGGRNGLMGAAAKGALESGADVEGVIPQLLQDKEVAHDGLTTLHITKTMHERQMKMADLAEAFVILPGGLGTLAEFFEIVTWRQLEMHQKPILLINHNGYWSPLITMLEQAMEEKFLHSAYEGSFHILDSLDGIPKILAP